MSLIEISPLQYVPGLCQDKGDGYKYENPPEDDEVEGPGGNIINEAKPFNLTLDRDIERQVD